MRAFMYVVSCLALCIMGCSHSQELSEEEKLAQDSLSKATQKLRADSLKKKNPLLIIPPDSNYSGEYTDRYASGIIKFKGYFRFGQRHGQWMSFYPNGRMWSEMHYDNGLRHGLNTTYFENGHMRYTGFYKNDLRDSTWIYYDSAGTSGKQVIFKKDRIVKQVPITQSGITRP